MLPHCEGMAVYVDPPIWEWRGKHWCHLTADTERELHEFAARLGLRRSWFQHKAHKPWQDHYDVTEGVRFKALKFGAVDLDFDEAGVRQGRRRLLFGALMELCKRNEIPYERITLAGDLRASLPKLADAFGVPRAAVRDALAAIAGLAAEHDLFGIGADEEQRLADHAEALLKAAPSPAP